MLIELTDFGSADRLFGGAMHERWAELSRVLKALPLHLKASDQSGIQGKPIFDPVGTNAYIKEGLGRAGWTPAIPIPTEYAFLGTDLDYGKQGVIAEAQFSNYPFLLNNALRGELFYKARLPLTGQPTKALVIITKAKMFPASQSTLYYEQAVSQLTSLTKYGVLEAPMRLVGLFERTDAVVRAKWTEYENARYSRAVSTRDDVRCRITAGRRRCVLEVIRR